MACTCQRAYACCSRHWNCGEDWNNFGQYFDHFAGSRCFDGRVSNLDYPNGLQKWMHKCLNIATEAYNFDLQHSIEEQLRELSRQTGTLCLHLTSYVKIFRLMTCPSSRAKPHSYLQIFTIGSGTHKKLGSGLWGVMLIGASAHQQHVPLVSYSF